MKTLELNQIENNETLQHVSGSVAVIETLLAENVKTIFGYPGGAIMPIYDALFDYKKDINHILVRHEQGAIHAAQGLARVSGATGVVFATSGPGATNLVTGLADAMIDSTPLVCITGQVFAHLLGTDAFQETDIVNITSPVTKWNYQITDASEIPAVLAKAFYIAKSGRPGPVLIDITKNAQLQLFDYKGYEKCEFIRSYKPQPDIRISYIEQAAELINQAKKPFVIFGQGVILGNAEQEFLEFIEKSGIPSAWTIMGMSAIPTNHPLAVGMLGMHGTYEANNAMHDCDLMINIGARFDDRITGKIDKFSPESKKIHIDIDPSSINKIIKVDHAVVGDVENVLNKLITVFKKKYPNFKNSNKENISQWWKQINKWREKNCLAFVQGKKTIKPQYAIERLYELTKNQDTFITTEVGQHQMWAAQYYKFKKPKRWMTSGGLGTMGFGLPAAIGVQLANPGKLVVDIAGEASILMNIQELSTAVQYRLPVKIFIINNQYMGMVRQWQELLHEKNYAESYTEALPDFVKLAEAYGAVGIRASTPDELDSKIKLMIKSDKPVLFDCVVDKVENCFPMIPSGKAHNEMILNPADEKENKISKAGKVLV